MMLLSAEEKFPAGEQNQGKEKVIEGEAERGNFGKPVTTLRHAMRKQQNKGFCRGKTGTLEYTLPPTNPGKKMTNKSTYRRLLQEQKLDDSPIDKILLF